MSQDGAPAATTTQPSGFWQEIESFKTPEQKDVAPLPKVGSKAPEGSSLLDDLKGRPTVILFLRHCGCPFAEKSFKQLTTLSAEVSSQVHFVAVSHSSAAATERWIPEVGGTWGVDVVVDEPRDVYAQWGSA
jgi:peroxiredoxin